MILNKDEFLTFLAQSLMYDEEPLEIDKPFPALVFDSTGKLMVAAAVEEKFGKAMSLDDLVACRTPGDIYDLLNS